MEERGFLEYRARRCEQHTFFQFPLPSAALLLVSAPPNYCPRQQRKEGKDLKWCNMCGAGKRQERWDEEILHKLRVEPEGAAVAVAVKTFAEREGVIVAHGEQHVNTSLMSSAG